MSKPDIPTFIIGLEKSKERYQRAQKLLSEVGINAQLWPGVDGRQPIKLEKGEWIIQRYMLANWGYRLSKTAIGCYLAHYRLLKYAKANNFERMVVFEDDVVPRPYLKNVIAEFAGMDDSYEYINLYPQEAHVKRDICHYRAQQVGTFDCGVQIIRPLYISFRTTGYMITRRGIERLVSSLMPIKDEVDREIYNAYWTHGLRYFITYPDVVITDRENFEPIVTRKFDLSPAAALMRLIFTPVWLYYRLQRRAALHRYRYRAEHTDESEL